MGWPLSVRRLSGIRTPQRTSGANWHQGYSICKSGPTFANAGMKKLLLHINKRNRAL